MFLINFLTIHSAVCVEPVLCVRGWNCVTHKMMSCCSVTFISHKYIEQVGPFSQSQNITGQIMVITANHDKSCFKHIAG